MSEASTEARKLERLTFFSDAVFAIAITLLVIDVKVPELHDATDADLRRALVGQIGKYIGFVVSFMVTGRFWLSHHRVFGMLRAANDTLTRANMLLLLGVAFMPFPTAVFSNYTAAPSALYLYSGWLALMGLLNWRVTWVALKTDELVLPDADPVQRENLIRGAPVPIAIGVLAAAAGTFQPLYALIPLIFGGPVLLFLLHRRVGGARRERG